MTGYNVYVDSILVHTITKGIENTIGEIVRSQLENKPTTIFIQKITDNNVGTK